MILQETERVMTVSVISSEDSGYDNGFLSDSSSSSGTLDCCYQQVCVFSAPTKEKKQFKDTQHTCVLNSYDVSGYNIEVISSRTFQYFTNCVKLLNLSNNRLKSLPETLCELKNLEVLNLSGNNLHSVPESCKVLHKLKVFNLSQNQLHEVPKCLEFGMERLSHIDLSYNNLSSFINPPLCLPSLQCFNISHNSFVSLPLWLFSEQCRSLLDLDLSFNFCFDDASLLSKLINFKHHRTSALKCLQKLNISNTGIKLEMIKCLTHFQSLECFFMGNVGNQQRTFNHIWEIPTNFFFNPSNVFELYIPNAGLAGLPDEFCRLVNIKVLDLSENLLDWLPDTFGALKSLEVLVMSGCNLSYLPDNFNQLCSLKKLLLDSNKLTNITNQLTGLTALEWLDLYDNHLEVFPVPQSQLMALSKLDAASNYIDMKSALTYEEKGESLLDTYVRLQANLRASDGKYAKRLDVPKILSNSSSWSSSESIHYHSSLSDDDFSSVDDPVENQEQTYEREEEEENWDDDCSWNNDYFDPNVVERYYLQPGCFKFGWTPPIRQRECVIPMKMMLSGFMFIPGEEHTKTSRRKLMNIRLQPTVDGQFDNYVGETADEEHPMRDLLRKKSLFVRNPDGPSKVRRCRFCSIYEDCWHHGVWLRF